MVISNEFHRLDCIFANRALIRLHFTRVNRSDFYVSLLSPLLIDKPIRMCFNLHSSKSPISAEKGNLFCTSLQSILTQ